MQGDRVRRYILGFLGFRNHSTPGSNMRRVFSRTSMLLVAYLALESVLPGPALSPSGFGAYAPAIWSLVFFGFVVLVIPFLTSHNWRPNALRLASDTLTSILLSILGFALVYRQFGLDPGCSVSLAKTDYVYFSAVTFSTLGYGDFAPCASARLIAATQAIVGNLHLGIIVGTAFLATRPTRPDRPSEKNAEHERNQKDDAENGD